MNNWYSSTYTSTTTLDYHMERITYWVIYSVMMLFLYKYRSQTTTESNGVVARPWSASRKIWTKVEMDSLTASTNIFSSF